MYLARPPLRAAAPREAVNHLVKAGLAVSAGRVLLSSGACFDGFPGPLGGRPGSLIEA